jgi:tetratricopeptide (TPR) repeat protein
LLLSLLFLVCGLALVGLQLVPWRVDPHRLRERAASAVKAERYDEAEAALARLDQKRALDWILQSKVDRALSRPEAALAALRHIPDSDPLAPLARYSEGHIALFDLHRAQVAEAALRRAVQLDPKSDEARQKLCQLYYILSLKAEFAAQFRAREAMGQVSFDHVYRACVIIRSGDETRQIIEKLREFVAADPSDRRSRLALANELRKLNRMEEAQEAQELLAALPEGDPQARAVRASLALDRGDLKATQAILAQGPAGDLDLAPLRGRLALARRDAQTAIREYQLAIAGRPDQRDILFGLGRALRMAGEHRAAEPYLKAAADLDSLQLLIKNLFSTAAASDPDLLHKLGAACEAVCRYPEARAWYGLALTQNPSAAKSREALARLLRQRPDQDVGHGVFKIGDP